MTNLQHQQSQHLTCQHQNKDTNPTQAARIDLCVQSYVQLIWSQFALPEADNALI